MGIAHPLAHAFRVPVAAAQPAPIDDEGPGPTPLRPAVRTRLYTALGLLGPIGVAVSALTGDPYWANLALYVIVSGALVVSTWPEPRA
jgi:hypothetical protein